jgi:hypothetical protein
MNRTSFLFAAFLLCAAPAVFAADTTDASGNDILCASWGCVGGSVTGSYQTFHGNSDGDWGSEEGPVLGLDLATPIPGLQDYGVGAQGSFSEGWYTFDGKGSVGGNEFAQKQTFLSAGLFRRPDPAGEWWSRFGAGFAYDVAKNHGFGTDNDVFPLRQFRGKASYIIAGGNEVGFWFTEYHKTTQVDSSTRYRAGNQVNLFYKYAFENGGHVGFFAGKGRAARLANSITNQPFNSHYEFKYNLGADAAAPINEYLGVYGGFTYGKPNLRNAMGDEGQIHRAYSVATGLRLFWGGNARVRDDSGRHWMPYLPDLDNGSMLTVSSLDN